MPENKELDEAIRKLETKHRTEDYFRKLGASDAAAAVLASSDAAKDFVWDGVNLKFGKSDLAAVDDAAAKTYFTTGPLKALFVAPVTADKGDGDGEPQLDPAIVERARAGNMTAKGQILRSLKGDAVALDKVLSNKGDGDDKTAVNGHGGSSNPFLKLRVNGKIDKKVEADIGRMIVAMGHKKVSAIAAAAKTAEAPLGMSLTGLPLRP